MIPCILNYIAGGFWPPIRKICSSNWVHFPQFWSKQLKNAVFVIHHHHLNSPEGPRVLWNASGTVWRPPFREGDLSNHKFRGLVANASEWMQQIPRVGCKNSEFTRRVSGFSSFHLSSGARKKNGQSVFSYLTIAVVFSQSHFQLKILGKQNSLRIWYPNKTVLFREEFVQRITQSDWCEIHIVYNKDIIYLLDG